MNKNSEVILPPATIGIVGGGQLGRMLTISAKQMGYRVGILDPTTDSPAGQVADFQIIADYRDQAALQTLARKCAVLTYEFENVDEQALLAVQTLTSLPQGVQLLHITGNRLREKQFLAALGIAVTPFAPVPDQAALPAALAQVGTPAILKTAAGGYDGHGQMDLDEATLPFDVTSLTTHSCILEARQVFTCEVAMMVARSAKGDVVTFPLVENQHRHHILHTTLAPARVAPAVHQQAKAMATKIATALELRGVLGIEFFVLPNGELLVNELAPRPHNSGHYSIEACNISQFEAHIRSICGLPLPEIEQLRPAVMRNLLGEDLTLARQALTTQPDWHFHDYGKTQIKPQRKMGHVTCLTDDFSATLVAFANLKGDH
ncbi:5-(carboxyamino)imidazole ribonucleotide synthase [Levilactobacillus yiduensis]|uniref:5-(carboxyamino)imidazole ribonucleotide synthase n=1 Tax=Levilactobacillus yiduensis TaxID=2953880 RepID=UPI000EF34641|nr:5-(carboxyamino)imidazole ribonucleotide synthase [Levilactobacillus yiduensis]AYM02920.1 5-(carboxyamino)imidazole ribonucleotide synthase [Levilactobacillus brevis]